MPRETATSLIPHAFAAIAKQDPDRIWISSAVSKNIAQDGFRDVTLRQAQEAIDRIAWHIEESLGKSSNFETVAYIGLPDARYPMVCLAGTKTGHKILVLSHFNSVTFNKHLCESTNCHTVLHTEGVERLLKPLQEALPMKAVQAPSLDTLLDDSIAAKPYPYTKSFEDGYDDPVVVGHTSGTTGLPKPVTWTQKSYAFVETHLHVPDLDGRPAYAKLLNSSKRCYQSMPIYHPFGLVMAITEPLYYGKTIILGPIEQGPISPGVLEQMFEHVEFDSFSGVPIYLEMMTKSPKILDLVSRKLKYILYAGGALSKPTGETLSVRTKLHNLYGSTEAGVAFGHVVDREDWEWLCLNEAFSGIEWEPCEVNGVGGVYEMTFVRTPETETRQHVFWHTDCGEVFKANDLFIKHPTKAHHWMFYSRKDDMIVTKFGWNVNPILLERAIAQHPAVKHVVVGGSGKKNVCAVIQLKDDEAALPEAPLESIWPAVEKGNVVNDAAGQLAKERIIFATEGKPFPLAGKGNVQRVAVLKMYEDELESLYTRFGDE
ncbi:Non-canonical non-ribosomal peptide synthetase FUB8 [Colletotrichum spinosum]|uniref:Non-canonical non-ribosomal peptide synthetase FUB8 n=1 Tax=Colletotrichum spinosum TaxID=1347390 RepID=A0A4R8QGR8_9PEZI|nr:Non-canonical non-ribosomal peptide synthetase FUB8 [Colletotrichum spinosum]